MKETTMKCNLKVIKPRVLTNADEYLFAINQIQLASTGFIEKFESNLFFNEACQCLINSIELFKQGYYDVAFCSLRQSIEISIGSLFLISQKDEIDKWNRLENGFEKSRMVKWLKEKEYTFIEMRECMSDFFNKLHEDETIMNKYIHKQGFQSFYVTPRNTEQEKIWLNKTQNDFEKCLKDCIGAVALYRLSLDAFPVALSDEDLVMRSPGLITEALSEDFLLKYIGVDNVANYKQTQIYKETKAYLGSLPKQSDAVYYLIHYQYVNRNQIEDYFNQWNILEFDDQLAVAIFLISVKVSRIYAMGLIPYTSETHPANYEMEFGDSFFMEIFAESYSNFNVTYKKSYLSRIIIKHDYFYIEHNEKFSSDETIVLQSFASKVTAGNTIILEELLTMMKTLRKR